MKPIKHLFLCLFFFVVNLTMAQSNEVLHLKVQGNKKLKTSFVKMLSRVDAGQVLDSLKIEEDIKLLKRLPSVSNAYYQVFHYKDNQYDVIYNIEENFTIIPLVNIYPTNSRKFAFRAGVYEYNAFGRNINVGGFYQKDIFDSYALNFRAPYLFSRKLGLALNYQKLNTKEPVFLSEGTADYNYKNISQEALLLYQFNFNHSLEVGGSYFTEKYKYLSGKTNAKVPLALVTKKVLYKAIYSYNNIEYDYQYLSGFKSVFNFQYVEAKNVSLPNFSIGWNDFNYYHRLGNKGNWATRLRLGLATNTNSPFAPFAVDNNINIRGVGKATDRGTGAIVINTEYRHTLIDKKWFVLQSNAFIDMGSWRHPGKGFSDFAKQESIRIHPGLGLRLIHKAIYNAIFRLDYGVGIGKNKVQGLVFGIGQYF